MVICVQWSMVNFVCRARFSLSRQQSVIIRAGESRAARGRGSLPLSPRLRPSALSGVNCTACVSPLRGLELVSVSVSPTLTCGVIKMSPLRGLAHWDFHHDAACRGMADFFFTLSTDGKCAKIFPDGKCSRTGPYAPTVGNAPARIVMANLKPET